MSWTDPGRQPEGRRWWFLAGLGVAIACYLVALLVVNLETGPAAGVISRIFPRFGQSAFDTSPIQAAWSTVEQNYYVRGVAPSSGVTGAESGIVTYLHNTYDDRFSALLTAAQYASLQADLGGTRSGSIGIALQEMCAGPQVCAAGQTATLLVLEDVLTDQPAAKAGLHNGDVLTAINGTPVDTLGPTIDAQLNKAAATIRGEAGTPVTLTVVRGGQTLPLTATRANLHIASVFTQRFGTVLYMQVTGFDTDTGNEATQALKQGIAGGATAVVLDLRGNGGGYVSAAQTLVSQFVAPAPGRAVVVQRGRLTGQNSPQSAQSVIRDPIISGGVALNVPVVALVDGDTASAAEITASALRDYGRATLVGVTTFGKGSVQEDFPLPDGNDLHLTVARWYGPKGESIEGHGLTPNRTVALASPGARFQLDTQGGAAPGDAQLQAALSELQGR